MRIKADNIRSEKFMCELFGLTVIPFRRLAEREKFNVSLISNKVRLYDMSDVVRVFEKYQISL